MKATHVTKIVHIVLLAAVVYVLAFFVNTPDFDLWTRLAVGSIFFQTGHVARHDVFSYLPTKVPWIDHEWGSGVVFYAFVQLFGERGLFILKGLLIAAIFVMIGKTIRVRGSNHNPTVLFYAFLGYALHPGIASLIRSHMFSYLFFVVWLYALERVRRGDRKVLWVFPATMLVWVNMHGGFLAGVGLLLLYLVGELCNRKRPAPYLWILGSVLLAMLVNPYGLALWRAVVEAALLPRPFIPEWHPISLAGPKQMIGGLAVHYLMGFMILAALTLLAALRPRTLARKTDWTKVIVTVTLFLVAVRHQRHVVFFVLAAASLWYEQFVGLLEPLRALLDRMTSRSSATAGAAARWVVGYVFPAAVVLYVILIPRLSHRVTVDYRRFPVGSLEFIKQNELSGNVATAFDWGSYAGWKLYPQCKVMIDGRYEEVFPNDVFDVAMRFSVRQGDWREALRRYHTDVIVLPKAEYQPTDLALLPDWRPAYEDFVSLVLLPANSVPRRYVRPRFRDAAYSRENLAKPIVVASTAASP
jgi:hypothetical protein